MDQRSPRFVVHSLDQARAALTAARAFSCTPLLISTPGYAETVGAPVFKSMMDTLALEHPDTQFHNAVDCGNAAGRAMAALREHVAGIIIGFDNPGFARIKDMAAQQGCMIYSPDIYEGDVFDMNFCQPPYEECHIYLAGYGSEAP